MSSLRSIIFLSFYLFGCNLVAGSGSVANKGVAEHHTFGYRDDHLIALVYQLLDVCRQVITINGHVIADEGDLRVRLIQKLPQLERGITFFDRSDLGVWLGLFETVS